MAEITDQEKSSEAKRKYRREYKAAYRDRDREKQNRYMREYQKRRIARFKETIESQAKEIESLKAQLKALQSNV